MAKERVTELAKLLREAANNQDPMARYAVELVKLTIADLQEKLVEADEKDMLRTQGAARQFRRLYNELTRTPPTITKE